MKFLREQHKLKKVVTFRKAVCMFGSKYCALSQDLENLNTMRNYNYVGSGDVEPKIICGYIRWRE
jgi:hypothetical protein